MKAFAHILLVFSLAARSSLAAGPPEGVAPSSSPPAGCEETVDGNFTIGVALISSKTKRESLTEAAGDNFACTLHDGILHDPYNRTGSIVANRQFQFDGPPQAGAIYTGGWSICKNNSLALGGSTIFYRCTSGNFQNLYDENVADQCQEALIIVDFVDQPSTSSSSSSVASSTLVTSIGATASASASSASLSTLSIIPITAVNITQSAGGPTSNATSFSASMTSSPTATVSQASASHSSTGGAAPTRVPRKETFGAVIGILGAALIL